jgi:hypothetical protein
MAETYKEPDKIKQYMASLEANLEKATGKSLAQWVKIAKACPFERPRERLKWFKDKHGLGQSRASLVLSRAFGGSSFGEDEPSTLVDGLFAKYPDLRATYDKIAAHCERLGECTISPRKSYVAFYRLKQFVTVKPSKKGLVVGLAMKKYPKTSRLYDLNVDEGDRVKKAFLIAGPKEFDGEAKDLIKAAWAEN